MTASRSTRQARASEQVCAVRSAASRVWSENFFHGKSHGNRMLQAWCQSFQGLGKLALGCEFPYPENRDSNHRRPTASPPCRAHILAPYQPFILRSREPGGVKEKNIVVERDACQWSCHVCGSAIMDKPLFGVSKGFPRCLMP